jgi:hypothetical protein
MPTDEELALKLLTGSLKVSETKGKRRRFVWGYPKHNSADEEEALRALARTLRDLARTFYESPHKSLSNPNWPVLQAVADALDPDVAGRKLVFNKPRQRDGGCGAVGHRRRNGQESLEGSLQDCESRTRTV